jgi:hypothetical protein
MRGWSANVRRILAGTLERRLEEPVDALVDTGEPVPVHRQGGEHQCPVPSIDDSGELVDLVRGQEDGLLHALQPGKVGTSARALPIVPIGLRGGRPRSHGPVGVDAEDCERHHCVDCLGVSHPDRSDSGQDMGTSVPLLDRPAGVPAQRLYAPTPWRRTTRRFQTTNPERRTVVLAPSLSTPWTAQRRLATGGDCAGLAPAARHRGAEGPTRVPLRCGRQQELLVPRAPGRRRPHPRQRPWRLAGPQRAARQSPSASRLASCRAGSGPHHSLPYEHLGMGVRQLCGSHR